MTGLTEEGEKAKALIDRMCGYISDIAGRKIYAEMSYEDGSYEGHIMDSGKCVEQGDNFVLSSSGDDIGMIFWGGYFYLKDHADAESLAWISLLNDCIGQSDDKEICECHNLTEALSMLGPVLNMNFKSPVDLSEFLDRYQQIK